MADNVEEPKQTEQPVVEEPTPKETKPEINTDEILAELSNLGVSSIDDLHNMNTASRQAGNLANKLGEKNQEVAQLRNELDLIKRQMNNGYQEPMYNEGREAGLSKDDIKNAFRDFYQDEVLKPQQQAYQSNVAEWAKIKADPRYKLAGDVFEKHIQNPNTQMALSSGQTNLTGEYNRVVITILEKMAGYKANETISKVTQPAAEPAKSDVPHLESGETASVPKVDTDTEQTEKIKKLTKPENYTGSTNDLRKLVDAFLPPGTFQQ